MPRFWLQADISLLKVLPGFRIPAGGMNDIERLSEAHVEMKPDRSRAVVDRDHYHVDVRRIGAQIEVAQAVESGRRVVEVWWGHVTLRMGGYPPFGTQVILNGHEWVERPAARQQVTVAKSGNCFVEGSDFAQVNRLAALLQRASAIGKLAAVCERWLYSSALCFAWTREEQQRSGFQYQYSVFQLELSRNLLFARGGTMDEVYQKLIDRTRQPLARK